MKKKHSWGLNTWHYNYVYGCFFVCLPYVHYELSRTLSHWSKQMFVVAFLFNPCRSQDQKLNIPFRTEGPISLSGPKVQYPFQDCRSNWLKLCSMTVVCLMDIFCDCWGRLKRELCLSYQRLFRLTSDSFENNYIIIFWVETPFLNVLSTLVVAKNIFIIKNKLKIK